MIYLDSSALVKLLVAESESAALRTWISSRAELRLASSELAGVEVLRACRRADETVLPAAKALLADMDLVPLTSDLLDEAATVGEPQLRSLDAVQLASALSVRDDLTAFVAYDRRLTEAASAAGLVTASPGT